MSENEIRKQALSKIAAHTAFQEILRKLRQMGGGYSGYEGFTVELRRKR